MNFRVRGIAVLLLAAARVTLAGAPGSPAWQPMERGTNRYSGMGPRGYVAETFRVSIPGVSSLQLRFGKFHLGEHSFVSITSSLDNSKQRMTARTMDQWGRTTAWFNGNEVLLELHVAPNDTGVYCTIEGWRSGWNSSSLPEDVCGEDDRVLSALRPVGRVWGGGPFDTGTCFIINNGKLVSAAHVMEGATAGWVIEFNVPAESGPDCALRHPAAEHQYHVNTQTIIRGSGDEGDDWAVFEVHPNDPLGIPYFPIEYQGFLYPRQVPPPTYVMVAGYGANYTNRQLCATLQEAPGSTIQSGNTQVLWYDADTENGNSGSPVIPLGGDLNEAVGVHKGGICDPTSGHNQGTSFFNPQFWGAVSGFSVEVNQWTSTGAQIGDIGRWNGTDFSPRLPAPATIATTLQSVEVLHGDTLIRPNGAGLEKYNTWEPSVSVVNHRTFVIDGWFDWFTSQFRPTYGTVVLRNELLEAPGQTGGLVKFKDPWLIDSVDASHGHSRMNRGFEHALSIPRASPFSPDYQTSYGGNTYKGVFLRQGGADPQHLYPPYYVLEAVTPQSISINGGQPIKWVFQDWYADSSDAGLKSSSLQQTGVLFYRDSAVVQARFKGSLVSNFQSALGKPSQRKVATAGGITHVVYESLGSIWYTHTQAGGWTDDRKLSEHTPAGNPHVAVSEDGARVVVAWEEVETGGLHAAYLTMSTNGGDAWLAQPARLDSGPQYPHRSADPIHPLVVVKNGFPLVVYWKVAGGLAWALSTGGAVPVPQPALVTFPPTNSGATWRDISVDAFGTDPVTSYVFKMSAIQGSGTDGDVVVATVTHAYLGPGYGWNAVVQPNPVVLSNYSWMWDCRNTSLVVDNGRVLVAWDAMSSVDKVETRVSTESGGCSNPGTVNRHAFVREYNGAWQPPVEFEHCDHQGSAPAVGVDARPGASRIIALWHCGSHLAQSSRPLAGGYWSPIETIGYGNGVNISARTLGSDPAHRIWTSGSSAPFRIEITPVVFDGPIFEELVEGQGEMVLDSLLVETEGASTAVHGVLVIRSPFLKMKAGTAEIGIPFDRLDTTWNNWIGTAPFTVPANADSLIGELTIGLRGFGLDDPKLGNDRAVSVRVKSGSVVHEVRGITLGQLSALGVSDTVVRLRHAVPLRSRRGQVIQIQQRLLGQDEGRSPNWSSVVRTTSADSLSHKPAQAGSSMVAEEETPRTFALGAAHPNPFNPSTHMRFELPEAATVSLAVFDLLGRKVADLAVGAYEAGYHSATWNATGVASGVYLARFTATTGTGSVTYTKTHKLVLMK